MMESRVFVVIRAVEDGLTVTLTPLDPEYPAPGVVAAFRVPGAIPSGETVLHVPGATVLPPE